MKVRIDKIFDTYYDSGINKYVVFCRIKVGKEWRYERLFFSTLDEVRGISEGNYINLQSLS